MAKSAKRRSSRRRSTRRRGGLKSKGASAWHKKLMALYRSHGGRKSLKSCMKALSRKRR